MPASKPKEPAAAVAVVAVKKKPAAKVVEAQEPTIAVGKAKAKAKASALVVESTEVVEMPVESKKTTRTSKSAEKAVEPDTATSANKRGRKPKAGKEAADVDDLDLSDIEEDLAGEPVVDGNEAAGSTEKVKPLRMKISKAKERALMKEFGLDETVLSEEDLAKRRLRLKALIKLGKTRGYLTHGEISDHLPDKLVDAETLEVVISMLNDMGVAVYEHTPDAETLLLNQNGPTAATEEEAEEEAEAA
jgi:RNA polymerase primary sigma factor